MTHSAVASRYAKALADVVTAGTSAINAETALAELRAFADILQSSNELGNALTSPAVPPSRKRAVVGRIGDQLKISRIIRNFLFVVIDKRRITALPEIIHSFEMVTDERLGFARADVISAAELKEPQRGALNAQLERISGKRIRARYSVDESLIGGAVARIGSTVFDGSVRGQLQTLRQRLTTED